MASSFAACALQLVYSSALGALLQLLFQCLCSATEKLVDLESSVRSLESTLESLDSSLRPEALSLGQMIEQGHELVRRGSRVRWWNVFDKWYYSTKINKLQASLDRLILNHVVVSGFRKTERMTEVVVTLEEKMNTMIQVANDIATTTRRQVRVESSDKSFTEIIVASGSGLSGKGDTTAESLSR